jgi:hypothetical protein
MVARTLANVALMLPQSERSISLSPFSSSTPLIKLVPAVGIEQTTYRLQDP